MVGDGGDTGDEPGDEAVIAREVEDADALDVEDVDDALADVTDDVDDEWTPDPDWPLAERIEFLAERALSEQVAFEEPGGAGPDEGADRDAAGEADRDAADERALAYLRNGLWPVLETYIEVVSGGKRLDQRAHDHLETALNTWLEVYARCYGREIEVDRSVREVAEVFVDTHNVRDTAQLVTDVPDRTREHRRQ